MPLRRIVLDARAGLEAAKAVVVRAEGAEAVGDPAVDEVFALFADVYDYLRLCHFRDSLDDVGCPLIAVVHVGERYENASWDGGHAMIGDAEVLFHRFTSRPSVVYQLAAMGLLEHLGLRDRTAEAAALRTACANVFACLSEQFTRRQPASTASWLVGEDLFRSKLGGGAMYSLASPGSASSYDTQIACLSDAPSGADASRIAGVAAHAFYRFAIELEGYAWETAGRVWYATLTDSRAGRAWRSFTGFAGLNVAVARELYGRSTSAAAADAWRAVGVTGPW